MHRNHTNNTGITGGRVGALVTALCGGAAIAGGGSGIAFHGGVLQAPLGTVGQVRSHDFNGDGHVDLLVSGRDWSLAGDPVFAVLVGDGTGQFPHEHVTNAAGDFRPYASAIADMNGDGLADVLLGGTRAIAGSHGVEIYLAVGDGSFVLDGFVELSNVVRAVAASDLNGDGHADIVGACEYAHTAEVFFGDGAGAYSDAGVYGGLTNPRDIDLADLNRDGFDEILVGHTSSKGLSVLRNLGDGTFVLNNQYTTPVRQGSVSAVDMNGDGRLDVVTLSHGTVIVRYGNPVGVGLGAANSHTVFDNVNGPSIGSAVVGDFNVDGIPDVAVASPYSTIGLLPGLGGNQFGDPTYSSAVPEQLGGLASGDLNEDGYDDLVTMPYDHGRVQTLFSSGYCFADINYDLQFNSFDAFDFVGMFNQGLLLADLNSDGELNFFDFAAFVAAYQSGCP